MTSKNKANKMKGAQQSICGDTQHCVPQYVEEHKIIKPQEVFGSKYKSAKPKGAKAKPKPKPKATATSKKSSSKKSTKKTTTY